MFSGSHSAVSVNCQFLQQIQYNWQRNPRTHTHTTLIKKQWHLTEQCGVSYLFSCISFQLYIFLFGVSYLVSVVFFGFLVFLVGWGGDISRNKKKHKNEKLIRSSHSSISYETIQLQGNLKSGKSTSGIFVGNASPTK